jgi:hypothetical protein
MRAISILPIALLFACGGSKKSDLEKMQDAVREYYFLEDTAAVDATIIDTLTLDKVEEMIANVDRNLGLIQMDLDTLSTMIDQRNYFLLAADTTFFPENSEDTAIIASESDVELLKLRLKQKEIEAKRESYVHTERILNRLKRKAWGNVAGFNVEINFSLNGIPRKTEVLMDGEFNIVD